MYGERLARWEKAVDWPLMVAAVLFLIAYATQILISETGALSAVAEVVLWVTWVLFAVDYVVRLILAKPRGRWFVRHLLDLAIVVLPMLRPLRLMRFLTILAIIQRGSGSVLRGKVVVYTVGATDLMNEKDLTAFTGLSAPTLRRWRGEGVGPRFVKLGGAVRYRRTDVLAWLETLAEAS